MVNGVGGHFSYSSAGWYLLTNAWGAKFLVDGKDYTMSVAAGDNDIVDGTGWNWSFPALAGQPSVLAYPELQFGAAPKGDVTGSGDPLRVYPLAVSRLLAYTSNFDVSYGGDSSGFDVSYDMFFTSVPNGDKSTITNELMIWLHSGGVKPFGTQIGSYTDTSFSGTVYYDAGSHYTAFVSNKDLYQGQIDIASMVRTLQSAGIISPSEYLSGLNFGAEVFGGKGSLNVNSLSVNLASTTAGGVIRQAAVSGSSAGLSYVEGDGSSYSRPVVPLDLSPVALALSNGVLKENQAAGSVIGKLSARDPEGELLTYSLTNSVGGLFSVDPRSGLLTAAKSMNSKDGIYYTIGARVMDTAGGFIDRDFVIYIQAAVSGPIKPPASPSLDNMQVQENLPAGTLVGTATSIDPQGLPVFYSLPLNGIGAFSIDAKSGAITTTLPLDYERAKSAAIIVRATSSTGRYTDRSFTINVIDVNEAPTKVSFVAAPLFENQGAGTLAGVISGKDPEGEQVSYSLLDDSTGFFKVDPNTGSLTTTRVAAYGTAHGYFVKFRVSDPEGNKYDKGAWVPVTPAPSISITSQSLYKDTGLSSADNVTSVGSVTLTGTVYGSANISVQIFDGSVALGAAMVDVTGAWTYTTQLSDGTHVLSATATDTAGNVTQSGVGAPIVVDTVAPSFVVTSQALRADTGVSASDNITRDGTVTLTGSVSDGAAVQIFDGSVALGAAMVDVTGAWTYTTQLSDGTHVLSATATDTAGNVTQSGVGAPIVVDTVAPSFVVTSQALRADTGVSASDNITRDGTVTLTGSVSDGAAVQIFDGSVALGAAMVDVTGAWTYTTQLSDGTHVLSATATDTAGNVTQSGVGAPIVVDTVAPSFVVTSQALRADTGVSASDNITRDGTVTLTGSVSDGAAVQIFDGSVALGAAMVDVTGAWTYTTQLSDGTHVLSATATDTAGNVTQSGVGAPIVVDTVAPSFVVTSQALRADTGVSASDNITRDGTVTLTGSVSDGAAVQIFDGSVALGAAMVDVTGAWTYTTQLSDGTHVLSATATDTAGNVTQSGVGAPIVVDTVAPSFVVTSQALRADTGVSASDNITRDGTVTLTGSVSDGAAVQIFDGSVALGAAMVDVTGAWTYTTQLSDGTHVLSATATDTAGNVTQSGVGAPIVVDTVAPSFVVTSQALRADTGVSASDNITRDGTVTLTGSVSDGAAVQIFDGSVALGAAMVDVTGAWTYTTQLSDGTHVLSATATDTAGNVTQSGVGAPIVVISHAAPFSCALSNDTGLSSTDGVTRDPTMSGLGTPGATIKLVEGTTTIGSTAVTADRTWSIKPADLLDGRHKVQVQSTDLAGNVASSLIDFHLDTTPGSVTVKVQTTAQGLPTFSGWTIPNMSVQLFDGRNAMGTTTADTSGAWAYKSAYLSQGQHQVNVLSSDVAGNVASASMSYLARSS